MMKTEAKVYNYRGYVWPIAVSLAFFMFVRLNQWNGIEVRIAMFTIMILSFVGLAIGLIRMDKQFWSDEPIATVVYGVMIFLFRNVVIRFYFINGTKYLGTALAMILIALFIWKLLSKADLKRGAGIKVLLVLAVLVAITTVLATVVMTPILYEI